MFEKLFHLKEVLNQEGLYDAAYELDDVERKKLQSVLLDMYRDLHKVSEKYNIKIFMAGGSLLGAVRHKGFIPWDDDLDIGITRADFGVLKKIFEKELSDKYILFSPNYKNRAISRFPQMVKRGTVMRESDFYAAGDKDGIKADIFIMDNIPDNRIQRMVKGCFCNMLEFIIRQVQLTEERNPQTDELFRKLGRMNYAVRLVTGYLFSFKKSHQWIDILDRIIRYHGTSHYCGMVTGRKHYFGETMLKKELFPLCRGKFEGEEVYLFKNTDYYLKRMYGNHYMQVPPVEKREKHFVKELKFGD